MLQGISGCLNLIKRSITRNELNGAERYVAAARKSVEWAAGLTHRMLAFARRQALQPRAVEPDALIHGLGEMIQRTVGPEVQARLEDGVRAEGVWTVKCDPNQLESALLNLDINARDAMPDGGTLTIGTAVHCLTPADAADEDEVSAGDYVKVRVTDTGTGMSPDVLARAFEPFFTTNPIGYGTGLGLSQVFGFVRQSGGFVRLDSKPGDGTTVRVYLPRYEQVEDTALEQRTDPVKGDRDDPAASELVSGSVLAVDDEPEIRTMVAEVLRNLGCTVVEAGDGYAALRIVQSLTQIALLVTNVGMPGLSGRQLAEAARETRPDLPILLITGYAGRALQDWELARGMEVMHKTFGVDAFAARVRGLLQPYLFTEGPVD